jgi:Transposase IS116/IS110/IS902 family
LLRRRSVADTRLFDAAQNRIFVPGGAPMAHEVRIEAGAFPVGQQVYAPRHRAEWLNKIGEAGVRRRAQFFHHQLDALRGLRQAVRRDLLAESRKHGATKLLRQIPCIGPIRAALLIGLIQTPHRFRTKRQL